MVFPQGVKVDKCLLKTRYVGLVSKPQGVTWKKKKKKTSKSDDKINARGKKEETFAVSLQSLSIATTDVAFITTSKKASEESVEEWGDDGEGCVQAFGGFILSPSQLESCVPLAPCRFMYNSSAVSHRSWSRSGTALVKPHWKCRILVSLGGSFCVCVQVLFPNCWSWWDFPLKAAPVS